jgi:hypothetical protein
MLLTNYMEQRLREEMSNRYSKYVTFLRLFIFTCDVLKKNMLYGTITALGFEQGT